MSQISSEWLQTDNRQCQPLHHVHLAMTKDRAGPTIPISPSTKFQLKLATKLQLSTYLALNWQFDMNSDIEFCISELV